MLALPLGPYDLADPRKLKMAMADRDAVWGLWQAPITIGHQITMGPEPPILNWVLSDPPTSKAGHTEPHSILKWKCQSSSPATPVITQWAHEQSGHTGRDGICAWGQQHGLPVAKAKAMATAQCLIFQQQRPPANPQYDTIPQGHKPATSNLLWIHICPLCKKCLSQKIPWRMYYPSSWYSMVFQHSIAHDQGNHFTANEVQQWAHDHGIHWCYHGPPHLETACFTELRGNILHGCMWSESVSSVYSAVWLIARIHWSWDQGSEMGKTSATITPSGPLAKCLLLIPTTLCCAGLEILAPKEGMFLPGDTTMTPLNCKLRPLPGHFGLLMPLN
ncbi:unnamed protein product [Nyctereutes procyonoides]|uniref:(raccoon dog) hypothetical protein n=1 Tax=Nyctereutes procyonoides TaxID=34880 RepID=A0A811ZE34_NYCPR|nr:unnamed protein product [Nyctereutes procyonoides]